MPRGVTFNGVAVDVDSGHVVPVPTEVLTDVVAHPALLRHGNATGAEEGISTLSSAPLLIACQPILTSAAQGPVHGTVLVGRYLDVDEIAALAKQNQVALSYRYLTDPALPADFERAQAALTPMPAAALTAGALSAVLSTQPDFVLPLGPDSIASYFLLPDLSGQPALVVRVHEPRPIFQEGLSAVRYMSLGVLAIGLVFGLIMLVALQKTVISPLLRLSAAVASISAGNGLSGRVAVSGQDELGRLAAAINKMLQTIEREQDFTNAVIDSLPGMFFVVDRAGVPVRWNTNSTSTTGYADGELDHGHPLRVIADEDRALVADKMQEAFLSGRASADACILTRDGRRIPFRLTAARCTIEDRTYLIGMGMETTEVVQARNALQQHADRLSLLHAIDQATVAMQRPEQIATLALEGLAPLVGYWAASVYVCDAEGMEARLVAETGAELPHLTSQFRILRSTVLPLNRCGESRFVRDVRALPDMTPALQTLVAAGLRSFLEVPLFAEGERFGVLRLGSDCEDAFSPEQMAMAREVADQLAIAIQQARLRAEVQHHTADLEQRVAERTAELSKTASRLQVANEQLKSLDRMKSQFVSNVSHELRTPLANIKLYLSLIENGKPEKHGQYMATLHREAELLHRLIEDLLHLSRLDLGKVEPTLAPVDFNALLGTLAGDRAGLMADRGLSLGVQLDPALPPVQADARLLTQVLTNLMTNAMNYTPAGGRVTLSTCCRQQLGKVWVGFGVTDTGPGISEEDQARLFERFFRGAAAQQSRAAGTGLGLAICYEIVSLHGGWIAVESQLGKGSTFTVWLPGGDGP